MKRITRDYHHGNLRNALLEAAIARIEAAGEAGFTLRELAKTLGVSSAAPFRHFANKRALLAAVAELGYERLAAIYDELDAQYADDPGECFRRKGIAYVTFAVSHKACYLAMFSSELNDKTEFPELKAAGARVVGIAGGPQKCALLTDELGFDAAVDHRADDWAAQLKAATPDGIDVDFENVGGALMDAIFARLNIGARVALCGLISEYNAEDPPPGPRAFGNLLIQRALVKGFIVLDHFGQAPEAITEIAGLMQQGKLKPLETVVEGFEQLPTAINMLFDGKNVGKLVVKVG